MLLEKECEKLVKWFESEYPAYRIRIHQGQNTKDHYEEYTIDLEIEGIWSQSQIRIPPGASEQDHEFLDNFRQKFYTEVQGKLKAKVNEQRINGPRRKNSFTRH